MDPETERIKEFYNELPGRIVRARQVLKRPLTLCEKILYSHLHKNAGDVKYIRGIDYTEFSPARVAMQDATAQMALLQFMMAGKESSSVPASVHCDHLIISRKNAESDLKNALSANSEVYKFLETAARKYNIDFWKPGSGIIHQIIFENYAYPGGMMIGTDSHTPAAGGLGMIGIGVGGSDAVDVMAGIGWELRFPKIIGIKLTGKLSGWVSAKDVILKITGMISVKGGTGAVIEYFGEGARSLSATGKATICNMGAETGATCSLFPYDKSMADYLVATGRQEIAEMADCITGSLEGDPEVYSDPQNYFDNFLEINLSEMEPYINGPFTPDLATPISIMKDEVLKNGWPEEISAGLIGSCTNSSYEDISRAASVARNAIRENLKAKAELLITPGSDLIRKTTEKSGYISLFKKLGAIVLANACGPCIGQWDRKDAKNQPVNSVIHSFNRNFSKRTDGNPNTYAFVASPEIVTAMTISGKLTFNPLKDSLLNADGKLVKLAEPRGIDLPPEGFEIEKRKPPSKSSHRGTVKIALDPLSERLQILTPFSEWDGKELLDMPLLIKAAGKCTTDHISMAGRWLKFRGHLENISGNYMTGAVNSFNNISNSILNQITGKYDSVPAVATAYKERNIGSVVVGEDNFGEGSSREHAAMEPRFLNVRAIIVKSFARIHETNLKKQGVLALTFTEKSDYLKILENDRLNISGLKEFSPGKQLMVTLHHANGTKEKFPVNHSYNDMQIEWFKAGSALNLIKNRTGEGVRGRKGD